MLVALGAQAAFPERPIHIVVPYAAGGSTDIAARLIGADLSARLHVPVIIDNKPGAGGDLGAGLVAREAPDGYTLLFTGAALASAASMKNVPYNPRTDFIPITKALTSYFSILVNPNSPFKTMADVIAYIRANPGKLDIACSGALTAAQFSLESLKTAGHLDFQIVEFNGNAPANLAVASGTVQVGQDAAFSGQGLVDGGKVLMVAVSGPTRLPKFPNVPTIAESGVPGYSSDFSLGFYAPGKTPPDVVAKLNDELAQVLKNPSFAPKFAPLGMIPIGNTSNEFRAEFNAEIEKDAAILASLRASGALKD
jgi:tripartite-type tricarboxylate transporter receptor subunit TctC